MRSGSGQILGPIGQCKGISHLREICKEWGLVGVAPPGSHRRGIQDIPPASALLSDKRHNDLGRPLGGLSALHLFPV